MTVKPYSGWQTSNGNIYDTFEEADHEDAQEELDAFCLDHNINQHFVSLRDIVKDKVLQLPKLMEISERIKKTGEAWDRRQAAEAAANLTREAFDGNGIPETIKNTPRGAR